jgi:hypothetical protein
MPARNQIKNSNQRRASPRLPPTAIPSLKGVKLVAGPEVQLINISRGGALIESEARLSPGSHLCLRLVTAESVYLLKGRILRSKVAAVAEGCLRYQSAISFDEEFSILPQRESPRHSECAAPDDATADSAAAIVPESLASAPPATIRGEDESAEVETLTVNSNRTDFDLGELLRRNAW